MASKHPHKQKKQAILTLDDLSVLVADKKEGRPNYGAILHYFRLQMDWSAEKLALLYGEALQKNGEDARLITASRIYTMEQQNKVPRDERRRWILARLLDIPPFLFGLASLNDATILHEKNALVSSLLSWERVDVRAYDAALITYCRSWNVVRPLEAIQDIRQRINNIHNEIFYHSSAEKPQMLRFLCGYLVVLAGIADDQQYYDEAIELSGRAALIAKENKLYDDWAYALRQRGIYLLDRGEMAGIFQGPAIAQQDFQAAIADFDVARKLEPYISSVRKGAVLLYAGRAYAHVAQNGKELNEALKVIDLGAKEIGKSADEKRVIMKLDEERYHLDKSAAYFASSTHAGRSIHSAYQELEHADKLSKPTSKMRHLESLTLQAKAYFGEGHYPMAVAYAENALTLAQETRSHLYLAHLEGVYQTLRKSDYGKNAEVAQLGVELLKAQQPSLFH